jgi:hypothetical protein
VIAAAIPDAMLLPTDECFAQEVPEPVYDGLTCPKYALWDSNPGSWLTLRTWRKIHWSDESRFLLHVTDGRMRVWRHKNTAYTPRNIQPPVPYDGGSVMVWGCISHDCKLDLVTIQGNLTGDQYIRDVLQPVVDPHFDNHPLAARPVYMDDNVQEQ